FFMYLRGRSIVTASESVALKLRNSLYDHIQKLPYEYHVKAQTGDLIQRCTSDVNTIRQFLAARIIELVRMIFNLVIAVFFMFTLHVQLTFISFAVVPFIVLFSVKYYRQVSKIFHEVDVKEGELHTVLQENLSGVRVVRAFGREKFEIEKFEVKNSEFRDLVIRLLDALAMFWSVSNALSLMQYGLIVVFAIYLNSVGEVSVGTFIAFITYANSFLWPVRNLGRILSEFGQSKVAIGRIEEVLDTKEDTEDESWQNPPLNGDIVFDDVRFGFTQDSHVLKGMSFRVEYGQTVAILGSTGSGKSTIMHLLLRLYEPQGGRITIDGHAINTISKKWLRQKVGIVLQEPFLYSKTVFENLKMAKDRLDMDEAKRAAKTASVHRDIKKFDKTYDTIVGEKGVTLSGGQKQRLAIARTIIKDSDVLIFDDSLSAVDTETDAQIRQALKERQGDVTTFIISQRITTLMDADMILVVEDGKITDKGTHDELVARDGLYSKIWNIQTMMEDEFMTENA
ncbi:MAG: ABC transporter ATP-binding protein/permease, partial [Defluviitaleaceae bacterium]|nr:ABC transporter ATP-binding protein/permease [Defluviitaleaceae bacterium]